MIIICIIFLAIGLIYLHEKCGTKINRQYELIIKHNEDYDYLNERINNLHEEVIKLRRIYES